jgi:hypothetical protein
MKKMATTTPSESPSSCCDAWASLSNWPPYSTRYPWGIATFSATRAWMSSTTLRRSRPLTLLWTTIRRCTFSRMTKFGPRSRWIVATDASGI